MLSLMEKISGKTLPPIFKLSWIVNILPYYDYLQSWILLMKSLNSKSCDIWNENENAFMNWGRNYRKTMFISVHDFNSPGIFIIRDKPEFFNDFFTWDSTLFCKKAELLMLTNNGETLIFERSYKDTYEIKIKIVKDENISDFIPSANWLKQIWEKEIISYHYFLSKKFYLINYINETKVLTFKRFNSYIELTKMKSSSMIVGGFDMNQDIEKQIENKLKWDIQKCCCNPNILVVPSINKNILNSLSRVMEWIDKIEQVKVSKASYNEILMDVDELSKFLQAYQSTKICFPKLGLCGLPYWTTRIRPKIKEAILCKNNIAIPLIFDTQDCEIRANIIEIRTLGYNEFIALEISSFGNKNF